MPDFIHFAVCAANLAAISAGVAITWSSPVLPQLQSEDPSINPLTRPTTILEDSLIAGAANLGTIVAPLIGGHLCEWIGKKKAIMVFIMPIVVCHIICTVASSANMFIVARFFMGLTSGGVFVILPGFLTDISEIKHRGMVGSMFGVFANLGGCLNLLMGPWLSVRVFSMINLVIPVVNLVVFGWFVPGSPYDLMGQGHEDYALQSLQKLRGKVDVDKELAYIKEQLASSSEETSFRELFTSKPLLKALFVCTGLLFFQETSGVSPIAGFMQNILQSAGSSISPVYSSMIIGLIQLLINITSNQLVDRAGRKVLLIISITLVTLSLAVLGSYFYFNLADFIPVASIMMYLFSMSFGMTTIPWLLLGELFPAKYKPRSASIVTLFNFSLAFVINVTFPSMTKFMGMAGAFWLYAVFAMVGLGFIVVFVPETKGKSYEEIRDVLEGSKTKLKNRI